MRNIFISHSPSTDIREYTPHTGHTVDQFACREGHAIEITIGRAQDRNSQNRPNEFVFIMELGLHARRVGVRTVAVRTRNVQRIANHRNVYNLT